jgi:CBS domain-containing protein
MAAIPDELYSETQLVIGAKKGLYDRSRMLAPDATLAAIKDLKLWVDKELAFEEGASASFGRILSELWHAEYLDQIPPLLNRFERLVSAYFVRRGSVMAFHGFCNAWREGVLQRILQFAEEEPELNDQGHAPAPYALLAAGNTGRREQTLEEGERYFLVWRGKGAAYFEPFAYRIMAILDQYGLIGKEGCAFPGKALWCGSLDDDWYCYLEEGAHPPEQANRIEVVADLRHVCGDQEIGAEAVRQARSWLERSPVSGGYQKLAREVIAAPAALHLLGGIRVEKSGEYVGCCNPEQSGLHPLISAVRLLAARHSVDHGPTLGRLSALGSLGVLKTEQVEKLVASYHELAGLKVRREIALESPYLNPASLAKADRKRLMAALESVQQLQRLVRSRFLGKHPKMPVILKEG